MRSSPIEDKVSDIIRPVIESAGYRLVCLNIQGSIVQVMAENPETRNLGVDECATLSREISAILDVEDPIKGRYNLEVSSPGIDRPLLELQDFEDFKGFEAKVEIDPPFEGQKKFRGVLKGTENDDIVIDTDQGEVALPFESVHKAKLVLTDNLIKATRSAS